jgi:hypothetical protein
MKPTTICWDKRLSGSPQHLSEQMAEGRKLDAAIEANLKELGYGW